MPLSAMYFSLDTTCTGISFPYLKSCSMRLMFALTCSR
ncbi:unnamed protein product [Amoebophrya sp. A25]|nr:unnamed protein product [Amoebophrya sp. A25]|eukprot:GSA25T00011111001.1